LIQNLWEWRSNLALSRRLYQQSPFFLYITKMTGKDALGFMKNNSQTTQKNADLSDVFVRTNIIRQIGVGVSVFPGIA